MPDAACPPPPPLPADEPVVDKLEVVTTTADRHESTAHSMMGLPLRWSDTAIIVVLAAVADFCLYAKAGGSGAACVLLAALGGFLLTRRGAVNRTNWILAMLVLATASLMSWRHWWLLHAVGWLSLFAFTTKAHRPDWSLFEALWATTQTAVQAPLRLAGHFCSRREQRTGEEGAPRVASAGVSARVVLIPLAVCVLFLLIFAAANPVVARMFRTVGTHIEHFVRHIGEYVTPGRAALWILWLTLFAALIRPAVKCLAADWLLAFDEGLKPDDRPAPHDDSFAAALWTLVSVNVLFLAYNGIDSVYLYLKATLPEGITWTDYTHRGCGWLTLGLFVSSTVLGAIFWRGLNFHPRARGLKALSYVWAAQNVVLAVGSMRRLQMYIDYSGLTHLRITGIYGSLLVAAGLGIMVYKVHANRGFIWLLRRYILAFCAAVAILALTPNDWVCAAYNAGKIMEHKRRALRPVFLKKLSPEALPPLIPLLDYERDDGDDARQRMVRKGIAALLGQHLVNLEERESAPWSKQQRSAWWALRHLRPAREKILATLPPDQWDAALRRIRRDYDLASPEVQ